MSKHQDFENEMNELFDWTPLKKYNKGRNKNDKIPDKMVLKMNPKIKGKNIVEKIKNLNISDINESLFDISSIFYKGDSIDLSTGMIIEIKMDTAVFYSDPWGIKTKGTIKNMKKYGLTAEEYNEKITLINERLGKFVCDKVSDEIRKHNVRICTKVNGQPILLEIDKDFTIESTIVDNDRNAKDLNLKRWHIIINKK